MTKSRTLLLISILFGLLLLSACSNNGESLSGDTDNKKEEIKKEYLEYYRRGAENPKVVLEEYSDFFCPHCKNAQPMIDQLLEEYKDVLALEFHNFSFMGSENVHIGNECAGDQGKFWEYHVKAFKNQSELKTGGNTAVIELVQDLDLDKEEFKSCLLGKKYEKKIRAQMKFAKDVYNISGTPSFVIDGKLIKPEGRESNYDAIKKVIDKLINQPLA